MVVTTIAFTNQHREDGDEHTLPMRNEIAPHYIHLHRPLAPTRYGSRPQSSIVILTMYPFFPLLLTSAAHSSRVVSSKGFFSTCFLSALLQGTPLLVRGSYQNRCWLRKGPSCLNKRPSTTLQSLAKSAATRSMEFRYLLSLASPSVVRVNRGRAYWVCPEVGESRESSSSMSEGGGSLIEESLSSGVRFATRACVDGEVSDHLDVWSACCSMTLRQPRTLRRDFLTIGDLRVRCGLGFRPLSSLGIGTYHRPISMALACSRGNVLLVAFVSSPSLSSCAGPSCKAPLLVCSKLSPSTRMPSRLSAQRCVSVLSDCCRDVSPTTIPARTY